MLKGIVELFIQVVFLFIFLRLIIIAVVPKPIRRMFAAMTKYSYKVLKHVSKETYTMMKGPELTPIEKLVKKEEKKQRVLKFKKAYTQFFKLSKLKISKILGD